MTNYQIKNVNKIKTILTHMYLKKLHVKNFRGIKDSEIHFNKGLNILIGPNNSIKTTIIDALRICLSKGDLTVKV